MVKVWVALVLAATALLGCNREVDEPPAKPAPRRASVTVLTLQPETWTETIRAYGVVEAAEKVGISTDTSGTVRSVHCREGATVAAGEAVVRFDSSLRGLSVRQAKSGIGSARVRLEQARKTAERRQALLERGAIPREQLDVATSEVKSATAQLDVALTGHQLARHQLSKSVLLSPVTGVVSKRGVDPGEAVMPGQVLCTIQVVDAVRVVTYVTEREISALRVGERFKVHSPGALGHEFLGRIESLAAEADPRTGNFPVRLAVSNKEGLLRPGMAARVELRGVEHAGALLLPAAALVDRKRRRVAYRVIDGRAEEVEPIVAASTGDRLPVLRGLNQGDQVIVSGLGSVTDGTPVQITRKHPPPGKGTAPAAGETGASPPVASSATEAAKGPPSAGKAP